VALIIPGSTRCAACGEVIKDGDAVTGLPHFISDCDHPLFRFTDCGFHSACFATLREHSALIARIDELDERHGYPPRFRDFAKPS
jgi:hypothetical protein